MEYMYIFVVDLHDYKKKALKTLFILKFFDGEKIYNILCCNYVNIIYKVYLQLIYKILRKYVNLHER